LTQLSVTRFSPLLVVTVLTIGRRTVANLRAVPHLAQRHQASYRPVLSRIARSGLEVGRDLDRLVFDRPVPNGPFRLVGDDMVDARTGKTGYAEVRHRDLVRPLHSFPPSGVGTNESS
jgi:hypothetical protein